MSALRSLRQLTVSSSRAFTARTASRAFSRAQLSAFSAARSVVPATRAFSVSARVLGEGAADIALSQKLAEELKYESETSQEPVPEFLKSLKASGIWTLEDVAGNDEVTLVRKFGNENIRLMFSIADIQTEQESEFEENNETEEESNPETEEAPVHSYPIRCSFSITKSSGPGALTIDAMCQEGSFMIDNISFYNDASVGTELTADADWKRRGLYIGPQFDTLDVAVQEEFEKFLQERGIDDSLAMFIPEYAEYKEQKEYVNWLKNVKKFVEA